MNELLSLLIRNDRQEMNDALELLTHQEKAPLSPTRVGEREALSDLLGDRRACSLQNIKRRSSCRSHDLLGTRGDRRACSLQKGSGGALAEEARSSFTCYKDTEELSDDVYSEIAKLDHVEIETLLIETNELCHVSFIGQRMAQGDLQNSSLIEKLFRKTNMVENSLIPAM